MGSALRRHACAMVVDDDPDIRTTLFELLEMEGFTAHAALHGRDALDRIDALPRPCLVLLDLMMPNLDGWGFLEALGQRHDQEDFDVLVMSAHAQAPESGWHPRVFGFLPKPFAMSALLGAIGKAR